MTAAERTIARPEGEWPGWRGAAALRAQAGVMRRRARARAERTAAGSVLARSLLVAAGVGRARQAGAAAEDAGELLELAVEAGDDAGVLGGDGGEGGVDAEAVGAWAGGRGGGGGEGGVDAEAVGAWAGGRRSGFGEEALADVGEDVGGGSDVLGG